MTHTDKEIAATKPCICGGVMIQQEGSLQRSGIVVHHFPHMRCLECEDETYGADTLLRVLREAKRMQEHTGRSEYEYSELEG